MGITQADKGKWTTLLIGVSALWIVLCIILFPDRAFQASLRGLELWWNLLFPSLLTFLVATELLLAYGFIALLGVILSPVTRLLLGTSGASGWAIGAGILSGFPAGAEMTSKLRKKRLLTREEGERTIAAAHFANPVLIVMIIAAGFLKRPELGLFLLAIQLLALLIVAISIRIWSGAGKRQKALNADARVVAEPPFFTRCRQAVSDARRDDGRSFGKLLGDAVTDAVQALFRIGGLIIIFSVLLEMVRSTPIIAWIQKAAGPIFDVLHIPEAWISPVLTGLMEIHLGAFAVSQSNAIPLVWKLALIGLLLGFGGLSVHAQTISAIAKTDIRYVPFLFARVLHALAAFLLSFLLWQPMAPIFHPGSETPSFLDLTPVSSKGIGIGSLNLFSLWQSYGLVITAVSALFMLIMFISCVFNQTKKYGR